MWCLDYLKKVHCSALWNPLIFGVVAISEPVSPLFVLLLWSIFVNNYETTLLYPWKSMSNSMPILAVVGSLKIHALSHARRYESWKILGCTSLEQPTLPHPIFVSLSPSPAIVVASLVQNLFVNAFTEAESHPRFTPYLNRKSDSSTFGIMSSFPLTLLSCSFQMVSEPSFFFNLNPTSIVISDFLENIMGL